MPFISTFGSASVRGFRGRTFGLLLAQDPLAAAYSLRYVRVGYTGPVVRVRRSSDNAEQDFTPAEIEDGSLESFCGSGDGLVTTWYDQSGNSNDATQTSASNQPKIVDAGSLVTENGRPAIVFDGVNDRVTVTLSSFTAFTTAVVSTNNKDNVEEDRQDTLRGPSGFLFISFVTGDQYRFRSSSTQVSYLQVDKNQHLHFATNDGALSSARADGGTEFTGSDSAPAGGDYYIGGGGPSSSYHWSGTIQEVIFYPSDQSSNRELIETNINNHYGIF